MSFMIKDGDTLFSETIELRQSGDDLFYIPAVSDQNSGRPIPFKLITVQNGEFIFENKEHDFPQQIIYSHTQPDLLVAKIQGEEDGIPRAIVFRMERSDGVLK